MLNNSCALLLLSTRGLLLCSICEVVPTSTNGFMIYSFCISADSEPTTLSTGVSVGITAVVITTIVHCWIPSWSSSLPLHQQAPVPELQQAELQA